WRSFRLPVAATTHLHSALPKLVPQHDLPYFHRQLASPLHHPAAKTRPSFFASAPCLSGTTCAIIRASASSSQAQPPPTGYDVGMARKKRSRRAISAHDPFAVAKPRKRVPHEFVLEALAELEPRTNPMFGCLAVYVGEKIVLILRDKRDHTAVDD